MSLLRQICQKILRSEILIFEYYTLDSDAGGETIDHIGVTQCQKTAAVRQSDAGTSELSSARQEVQCRRRRGRNNWQRQRIKSSESKVSTNCKNVDFYVKNCQNVDFLIDFFNFFNFYFFYFFFNIFLTHFFSIFKKKKFDFFFLLFFPFF